MKLGTVLKKLPARRRPHHRRTLVATGLSLFFKIK